MTASEAPLLSIVIPLHNEEGNILPLADEIAVNLKNYAKIGENYEILCIDDGSTDGTLADIKRAMSQHPQIRCIRHKKCMGMSAGIRNAVRRARAKWVLTIDGDRQNDPADVPRLCELAWADGFDQKILVGGIRVNRQDTDGKRYASKFANAIRKSLLHDNCPDTGCALKLFQRDAYLELPFFKGLHRFMPALFTLYGHKTLFTPVNDRLRTVGVSKSDFVGRAVKGFFDLMGVVWLIRSTPAPDRGVEEQAR